MKFFVSAQVSRYFEKTVTAYIDVLENLYL